MGDTILYLLRLLDHEENSVVEKALQIIYIIIVGGVVHNERLLAAGVAPLLAKLLLSHKDQEVISWTSICVSYIAVVAGHNIESLVTDEVVNRLVEICGDENIGELCHEWSSNAISSIIPLCKIFFI